MSEPSFSPPDPSLYTPDSEEKGFIKAMSGIHNDDALKTHIASIQQRAYEVQPSPRVWNFEFLWLQMSRLPAYNDLLTLTRERRDAIFVDLSGALGCDIRRAVIDGFPPQNIIATDLHQRLWDLGHELFRSTPTSLPVRFLPGNLFDPVFLAPGVPLPTISGQSQTPIAPNPVPTHDLTSLSQLHGRVSAIHAGALFDCFSFSEQAHLARAVAGLLAPHPGAFLFGSHTGQPTQSAWAPVAGATWAIDCHSPDSWRAMWERVFGEFGIAVVVQAHLRTESRGERRFGSTGAAANSRPYHLLEWSVARA